MMLSRFLRGTLVVPLAISALAAQQLSPDLFRELHWRCIGPFRGGRTRAATGVRSQPNVFYMAQVNGGVWKSDDFGRTWNPIFDSQPTQSVGAVAVAPSDPKLIYVASGEGLQRPDLSVGNGIYKSTDGGLSWTHLGLRDGQQIPALAVDPRDGNRLFAAVLGHPYGPNKERGIFRSTDGGQTWQPVLQVDENTGGNDVQLDPANPDVVYASMWEVRQGPWEFGNEYAGTHGGLFKSVDGGNTWRKLTNGLPADVQRIYAAIAPSNPSRVYATCTTAHGNGIYRSDNGGENWYQATTDKRPSMDIGGSGGDLAVPKVDPKNADVVYSTSIVTFRSADGAKTWTPFRGAPGGDDYQNIWINPDNPDIILLVSDQGALVTVNRGQTWSSWYNQPTAQLYHVSATNTFPYLVCGGQQESGSVCTSSRGNDGEITFRDWHPVGAIEYGYVAPDPADPDIIYGAGRGQVSRFHRSTGQVEMVTPTLIMGEKYRADRTQPILFSPLDPHVLYYAGNFLFRSTDGARTWQTVSPDLTRPHPGIPASLGSMAAKDPKADKQRGVIYSIAPSFRSTDTIWAGTDDGLMWITRDGGKNWKDITPPEVTPWSKVTQLEASHYDDESAYASVSRFRVDDLRPYIYRTHDGGKTWQLITAGLPDDAPVDTVREDPLRKGLLFAGTETSVWVSFDDGDHWQSLQLNLPHSSMRDLIVHDNDLLVATHGRSFWILDDLAPLRQIREADLQQPAWLSNPAAAVRVRRSTNTDTPLPPDEPAGENPPTGAIIDYYLARPATAPVVLEILDAAGAVVRRYASTDQPDVTEASIAKQIIPPLWIRMPRILPSEAGLHRWVWDLHYAAPDALSHEYPISAVPHNTPRYPLGPRALPGQYTVRLTIDGRKFTAPLELRMDPRVKTPRDGLREMFDLQTRLASMMTTSTQAIREARAAQKQIEAVRPRAAGPVAEALKAMDANLSAVLKAADNQATIARVNRDVSALYTDVDSADATPTAAEVETVRTLDRDVATALGTWTRLRTAEMPLLNNRLRAAGLPEINLAAISTEEEPEEEE